jgi:hypothetical protein
MMKAWFLYFTLSYALPLFAQQPAQTFVHKERCYGGCFDLGKLDEYI